MFPMSKLGLTLSLFRQKETAAFHTQQYTGLSKPGYGCSFKNQKQLQDKHQYHQLKHSLPVKTVEGDFNLRKAKRNRINIGTQLVDELTDKTGNIKALNRTKYPSSLQLQLSGQVANCIATNPKTYSIISYQLPAPTSSHLQGTLKEQLSHI